MPVGYSGDAVESGLALVSAGLGGHNRLGRPTVTVSSIPPIDRLLSVQHDRRTALVDIPGRVGVSVDLGLLRPLERLPRDEELATTFGVAHITVRRALSRLCVEGILTRRRGRGGGTFVSAVRRASRSIAPTGETLVEASRDEEELLVVPVAELGGFDERTDYLKFVRPLRGVRLLDKAQRPDRGEGALSRS